MKLLGYEVTLRKSIPVGLQSVTSAVTGAWNGFWGVVRESYAGAWQQNVTLDGPTDLLRFGAVWCCVTGISTDIAKLRPRQMEFVDGVWREVVSGSPFLPVLRKPNDYQNHIEFIESWILSKMLRGNAYVLLNRDNRGGEGKGIPVAMYVLNPDRVTPLVAPDGSVYYKLSVDNLSGVYDEITVPASEMIHDTHAPLWHPLIGLSPLHACAISATMGNRIQADSTQFAANRSMPSGMLTAPGRISQDTADRMKANFESKFSGENIGRLFVGGDGLKFEPIRMTAEANQLAEQLKFTVSDVARAFHYPEWKLGGSFPPYSGGPQAVTTAYYTDCLQILIEKLELALDTAFRFGPTDGIELDTENLLRMDTVSLMDSLEKGVRAGIMAPNEGRKKLNLAGVPGGDTPYMQQQDFSLAALAKRDAGDDPFASSSSTNKPAQQPSLPSPAKAASPDDLKALRILARGVLVTG